MSAPVEPKPEKIGKLVAAKRFLLGKGELSDEARAGLEYMIRSLVPRIVAAHAGGARLGANVPDGDRLAFDQIVNHPIFDWGSVPR